MASKSELITKVAAETEVSTATATKVVNSFLDQIETCVRAGEKVTVPGAFNVEVTDRAARTGRNPQTGEELNIPATKSVKVSAGSKWKAAAKGE